MVKARRGERAGVAGRGAVCYIGGMTTTDDPGGCTALAALCVLASGSSGNCSVVAYRRGGVYRLCLIDLGLSPRRTRRELAELGLGLDQIDDVLLTHTDGDHLHPGWAKGLPRHVRVRLHAGHARRASRLGLARGAMAPFESSFVMRPGLEVRPVLMAHDEQGVCAFRVEAERGAVGYATDLGRATPALIEHLRGVDVLALESNYCPRMQMASGRPAFLKRRIMGGRGHLSNAEAVEAARLIGPREHVVLLHLSRECNCPELAAGLHDGAAYALTVAEQDRPTRWVRVGACEPPRGRVTVRSRGAPAVQISLLADL